ncbi:hypothetical protein BC939DRAFT_122303 [Gamsiella multidivaricata]|uniref:uncharacterized protein n=1 Tax=Gamsiella multidivaricata TaxID=101098 RepID=UPI00221F97AB|nr:uncharacterized protein BC939DRAFT_122303 [Gamsiella multidivaricata]KAI7825659.1 hypothetical protein BC939DRAFT_122303 [Gamsiella multidivaricata]
MLKLRHQTDMDVQAGSSLAGWLATDRSPTTMQFVSPHPVYFDQHSSRQSISSARKGHRRSGRHASSKQGPSSTKRQSAESAFSRHSSRYHFPLTSSPSSSSLVSSGDDSESSANDRQSANSDMVLNIGSRGRHSSTLSFGAPKSPAHDGSSSAESITGPVSASASSPSSVSASDRTRLLDSGLDRSSRHAFKKQRKNYQFTTATSISSLQSKSETSLKRPIFGLEESSNLPAYSLSQSDSERTDTKGKRPDHSGYMTTSGGSSSKSHGPSTTFHPNLWNTVPDGGAVIDAIEVYNIDMTSIQPPFPSYLSQASSKAQDLNSVWSGGDNASSSVTSKHPKENDHDLPPLSGDWRFPTQVATPYRGIEIIKTISDNALKAPATSMGASAAVTGPELQTGSVSNFVPSLPRLASTEVIPATLERSRSSRSARSIPTVEIPRDESHISTHIERDTSGTSRMPIPCSDAISSTTSRSSNIDIATGSGHSSSCVRSSSSRSFETTHPHPNSSTLTTSFQTSSHAAPHSTMAIINHLSTTSLNYHTPINTDSAVGGTNTISVGMDYTSDSEFTVEPP